MVSKEVSKKLRIPHSQFLIKELADQLLPLANDGLLSECLVVLPNKRLGLVLEYLLAQKLQAFIPPRIMSFEDWVKTWLSPDQKIMKNDELFLKCTEYVKSLDECRLSPKQLIKFCREYWQDGRGEDLKVKILDTLALIPYGEETKQKFNELHHDVFELVSGFEEFLNGFSQKPIDLLFQNIEPQNIEDSLSSYERVFISGLTTLNKNYLKWISTIHDHPKVCWVMSEDIQLAGDGGISDILKNLSYPQQQKDQNRDHQEEKNSYYQITSDIKSACKNALEVTTHYVEQGATPPSIGVVVLDEELYYEPLQTLLKSQNIKSNFALSKTVDKTLHGSFLSCLCAIEEDIHEFLNWFTHDLTKLCFQDKDIAALFHQLGNQKYLHSSADVWVEVMQQYDFKVPSLKSLLSMTPKPLSSHLKDLHELITDLGIWEHPCHHDFKDQIQQMWEQVFEQNHEEQTILSKKEFFDFLKLAVLEKPLQKTGEPFGAIQIMSLREARYVSFDVVVFLGMNDGLLPKKISSSGRIFDEYIRRESKLPTLKQFEKIERTSFELIYQQALTCVFISTSHIHGKASDISPYVLNMQLDGHCKRLAFHEEEITPEFSKEVNSLPVVTAVFEDLELEGETLELAMSNHKMAVTKLYDFMVCPFRFVSTKAKNPPVLFSETKQKMHDGTKSHFFYETFLKSVSKNKDSLLNWSLDSLNLKGNIDLTKYQQLKWVGLPQFKSFLSSLFDLKSWTIYTEYSLDPDKLFGLPFSLYGSVDCILESDDAIIMLDFKSSLNSYKNIKSVFHTQLLAYSALLYQHPKFSGKPITCGYWDMYLGEWLYCSHDLQAPKHLDFLLPKKNSNILEPAMQELGEVLQKRWGSIQKLGFYPDASSCGYCRFRTDCHKDSPEYSESIEKHMFLAEWTSHDH